MKINKITSNIDERFNPKDLPLHYDKHVSDDGITKPKYVNPMFGPSDEFTTYEYPTEDDYDEGADRFARRSTQDKNIESFYGTDGRYYKRDIITNEFTVYDVDKNKNPINISYYIITDSRWNATRTKYYKSSIRPEEDAKPL